MNTVTQAIVNHLAAHWEGYTAAATVLGIAAISCLPEVRPKTADEWYAYIRHTLQTASPAARAAQAAQMHIQTTQTSTGSTRTEDSTYTAPSPLAQPGHPAQPQK